MQVKLNTFYKTRQTQQAKNGFCSDMLTIFYLFIFQFCLRNRSMSS